jgi:peptide/nickel transport system substrate-binding protein
LQRNAAFEIETKGVADLNPVRKRRGSSRGKRRLFLGRLSVLPALLLAGSVSIFPSHLTGGTSHGATVTFAEQPGSPPDYVFPLQPAEWFTFANDQEFSYLLYPTLYWIDRDGQPVVNNAMSLAYPPVFSVNAAHDTVATITLKDYSWSDGVPVTTRDVEFWMNLLVANKTEWGDYVPGQFPDNVKSITYPTKKQFVVTFNRTYNHYWLQQNELNTIIPMPQHAWDRTSLGGPVGNYDTTTKGAVAVWNFLNKQSMDGSTYATNPLWQVVDGPWKIQPKVGYNATTGYLVLVPNSRYSGQSTHAVAEFVEEPFTSASAEFDAVRSGSIDYGYLPLEDATSGLESAVRSEGYQIVPWEIWGWNFWPLNFAQPTAGPIFKQLYVRQALEHLIDQSAWIKYYLRGFGYPEYSDIPTVIKNPYADSYVKEDHYSYSVSTARSLLKSHGWKVVSSGVTTCVHPGTGANECGPGVKSGAALSFSLEYSADNTALSQEVLNFQTTAAQIGIRLSLVTHPFSKVFADYFSCFGVKPAECHWQIIAGVISDEYGWYPYYYPDGAENYNTGSGFNGGQYSSAEMDSLTHAAHELPGLAPLHAADNYAAYQLPTLWVPNGPYQISVIKKSLHVSLPQGLETNVYPQLWTVSG